MVRVANCNPKDTENYDKKMLDYVKTHMAPQVRWFDVQQHTCTGQQVCSVCVYSTACVGLGV
jgi:hypothetical protein